MTPAEEQQEAIKTLQRALDNLRLEQSQNHSNAHSPQVSPTSATFVRGETYVIPASLPIGITAANPLWLPDSAGHSPRRQSAAASFASGITDTSHLSVQAQNSNSSSDDELGDFAMASPASLTGAKRTVGALSDHGMASITPITRIASVRTAAAFVEEVDPRRVFIEKALDVSDRAQISILS